MRLFADGAVDVVGGFESWRIWWMLSRNDVVRRYRRSRVGQFWLTLSMAVLIFGMGAVYSLLFKIDLKTYLPHVGTGLILWGLISTILNESGSAFTDNENIMRQVALPRFTYVLRTVARNVLVFAHNLILLPILFLVCGTPFGWESVLFVPGLLLVLVNLTWCSYFLAILSTRFRDIPQIVQSFVQIAFFVSPVIFKPSQLPPNHLMLKLNPFTSMLEVMREPLIGQLPSLDAYIILAALAVVGWTITLAFANKYSSRVIYWL